MKIKSFKLTTAMCVLLIWLPGLSAQAQSNQGPPPSTKPRLTGMSAMLFYETNGKFSPDVFTNQVNLFNTVIEGSSREGASSSMLVVVEVSGDRFESGEGRKIELTARYHSPEVNGRAKPAFFQKTMSINLSSENKFFAGFWLYDTGCFPVRLSARILGQRERLQKTINLRCGE